ncbi:MAG: hypothetical protein Q8M88_04340, partial [Phenylobacterium sp.]|uniref:hypothetical protein n=1 Tax=Phenylobacterium sp. TaxID=1871053 RepID=UPI002733017F
TLEVDEIIFKVYNQDFNEVPEKIETLRKTSPQISQYIKIDYLWWKMISFYSNSNESEFIAELDELKDDNKIFEYQNYDRLIYFTYQIRYENLKDKKFSKYLTLLKFHFFMKTIDMNSTIESTSFVVCMFKLMNELDEFMKYKFLYDHGFNTKINLEKCSISLQRIENIHNYEYKSFDVVKTYLLAKIYLEIENDNQKALNKFQKLSKLFPGNNIFKLTVTSITNR